jgi:hypothetical protein
MRQWSGVVILTAGLVAGCASHWRPSVGLTTPASVQREEQLAELAAIRAVLRAAQAQWKPEPGWERPTFYLSWLRSPPSYDPPSWALAEFRAEPYSVRKVSRYLRETCQRGRDRCPCGDIVYVEGPTSVTATQFQATVALGYPWGWLDRWKVLLVRDGPGWRSEEVRQVSIRVEDSARIAAIKAVLRHTGAEAERPTYYLRWRGVDPPSWVLAEFGAEPYSLRKASRHSRDTCWGEEMVRKPFPTGPAPVRRKRVPCGVIVGLEDVTAVSSTQCEASVMLGDPGWRTHWEVPLVRDGTGWRSETVRLGVEE